MTLEISTPRACYTRQRGHNSHGHYGVTGQDDKCCLHFQEAMGRFLREPLRTPINPHRTTTNPTDLVSQLRVPHIINTPHPRWMRPWPHGQQAVLPRVTKTFSQDQRPQAALLCSAQIQSLLSFKGLGSQMVGPWPWMKGDKPCLLSLPGINYSQNS